MFKDWSINKYQEFIDYLKKIKDDKYKEFHSKLIDTKYEILGIRMPILKSISKEIVKGDYKTFLNYVKNNYYEEVMIKLLVIASIKDIEKLNIYFCDNIDLIDNWALCDTFCNSLKIVNKNKEFFLTIIDSLIKSNQTYRIRVGLVLMLCYYVEEKYLFLIINYINDIKSDEYYVCMAISWLLCEMFIKYPKFTIKYLENNNLNKFTINKTISKIRDSYRVDKEMKDYIKKYKK